MTAPKWMALTALLCAAACGGDDDGGDAGPGADAGPGQADAAADAGPGVDGGADAGPRGEDAGPGGPLTAIALPQAVGGVMWANPAAYDEVPLHVRATGVATAVRVQVGEDTIDATDPEGDGDWVARVPLAGASGTVELTVTAEDGATELEALATLHLGERGVQLTDYDDVGPGLTPRLHRVGDELWLTWADASEEPRRAYARRLDGAARHDEDPIPIVTGAEDTIYARAAFGAGRIGTLSQRIGGPYRNFFEVVDTTGASRLEPVALDPEGWFGSYGGDVVFDGEAWIVVYRVNDGAGGGRVYWLRVDGETLEMTGPVLVAESGDGDPVGGFDPISFLKVQAVGNVSLVAFVRGRWDASLEFEIPKAQIVTVDADGTIVRDDFVAAPPSAFTWHSDCRIFSTDGGALVVFPEKDLTDPDPNAPNVFHATQTDETGLLRSDRGGGTVMFEAPDDRGEPSLVTSDVGLGVLAWTDSRTYAADLLTGRIQLHAGRVTEELKVLEEVVFEHARFIASTAQVNGAPAGTNALLVWVDERTGGSILDSRPEIYFETVWY